MEHRGYRGRAERQDVDMSASDLYAIIAVLRWHSCLLQVYANDLTALFIPA